MVRELSVGWGVGLIPEGSRVQGDASCEHTAKGNSNSVPEARAPEEPQGYRDQRVTLTGKRHCPLGPSSLLPGSTWRRKREPEATKEERGKREKGKEKTTFLLPPGDDEAWG